MADSSHSLAPGLHTCSRRNLRGKSRHVPGPHPRLHRHRALGTSARYVSGYLHRPDGVSAQDGGHAWAEAHVPELGWVGFDPAEGLCVTDRHIRIAIGLDGLGAARVRGAHYGGGREVLAVKLQVTQASWQTQG